MKKLVMGLGCVLIIIAGCMQGYAFYQQYQIRQNNLSIYNQAYKLFPKTYMGTDGYLVIDDRQVKGVITGKHFKLAFGKQPLPFYNDHVIKVDDAFKKDLQVLNKDEVLQLHLTSGEIQYYQIVDIGTLPYDNITHADLVICTYGQTCFYINAKRVGEKYGLI